MHVVENCRRRSPVALECRVFGPVPVLNLSVPEAVVEIFLLVGLVLLNGLFAMSEMSLVSAKRGRLSRMAEDGDRGAAAAMAMQEDPTRFLSTVQIGITSIGVLNGMVGESVFAGPLAERLVSAGVPHDLAGPSATVAVVVLITYFSIVLGELVPKRIGQSNPEALARLAARPMGALARLASPFVRLLSLSTDALLKLLGQHGKVAQAPTEEEIRDMIDEGASAGVIEGDERDIVRNVFRLDDRQLGSMMVPRADMVFLDADLSDAENLALIAGSPHSRFPVARGGAGGEILGVASARDMLAGIARGEGLGLAKRVAPAVFVPDSLSGMELLNHIKGSGGDFVMVVDEYGEIQGMATMHDVMEALAGEFKPARQEDAWAVERADGSWLLDGKIPLPELKDRLGLSGLPEEDRGLYHTLGGMVMWILGKLPSTGDVAEWDGWNLEVVDMDGRRIDKVLAARKVAQDGKAA